MKPQEQKASPTAVLKRVLGYMLHDYKFPFILVVACILISAIANVMGATFPQTLVDDYIVPMINSGSTDFGGLGRAILQLVAVLVLGVAASYAYNRIMVSVGQGTMRNLRNDLFRRMESLPIKYFDTHAHGDIMSVYTNDVDTLRQLLGQSIPQIINSAITMAATLVTMLLLNPALTVISILTACVMLLVTKNFSRLSAKYYVQQQRNLANADGFIRRLPDGYDTMLTGDGANLSQGQRQLIAIARATVADPPVLILDEATSSIDTRTEKLVQDGMDALMTGRTTFVIAHRLSTVRNADCIMVMEQGRIIERGTHDELIEKKGKYYQLYTGNFAEETA